MALIWKLDATKNCFNSRVLTMILLFARIKLTELTSLDFHAKGAVKLYSYIEELLYWDSWYNDMAVK